MPSESVSGETVESEVTADPVEAAEERPHAIEAGDEVPPYAIEAGDEPSIEFPEVPRISLRADMPAFRWSPEFNGIPTSSEEWERHEGAFRFHYPESTSPGRGPFERLSGRWRSRGVQLEVTADGRYVWVELVVGGMEQYSPTPVVCAYSGQLTGRPSAPRFWSQSNVAAVEAHQELYADYAYCSLRGLGPYRPFRESPSAYFQSDDAFTWVYRQPFPIEEGESVREAIRHARNARLLRFVRVGESAPARPERGHRMRGEWIVQNGDGWGTLVVAAGDAASAEYEWAFAGVNETGTLRCTRDPMFPTSGGACSGTISFTPNGGVLREYDVGAGSSTRIPLRPRGPTRPRGALLLIANRSL